MLHWTSQFICLELNLKLNERSEPDDFLGLFWSLCGYPIAYYKKKTKKVQDQTQKNTINSQNQNYTGISNMSYNITTHRREQKSRICAKVSLKT